LVWLLHFLAVWIFDSTSFFVYFHLNQKTQNYGRHKNAKSKNSPDRGIDTTDFIGGWERGADVSQQSSGR
jgi:hypothetical protein